MYKDNREIDRRRNEILESILYNIDIIYEGLVSEDITYPKLICSNNPNITGFNCTECSKAFGLPDDDCFLFSYKPYRLYKFCLDGFDTPLMIMYLILLRGELEGIRT